MTIVVTGATGNVGAYVVRGLTGRGEQVRVVTRDRDRAAHMFGPGVEIATRLDVAGADRLFLACANTPDQVSFECAAIDAAAGVSRVVKLSGPDASVDSPLIFERWHGEIERHLGRSGLPHTLLRPRTFMTNLLAYAGTVAATGRLFAPAGAAAISFVDPRDVAEAAVAALTSPGHEGRTYRLTGPSAVTFEQIAAELSAVTGSPVTYVSLHDDQAREAMTADGLPPMLADAIVAIFRSQRSGSMADTTDAVEQLTGHGPRTVADFLRDHAGAFRNAGQPVRSGG